MTHAPFDIAVTFQPDEHRDQGQQQQPSTGMSYIEPAEYLLHPNFEPCLTSANV